MVSGGVFLLDRTQPRFYTCCGRVHIKIALLGIICFLVFIEAIETVSFIMREDLEIESLTEGILEILEYITTFMLIIAFIKEEKIFLIPFIGQIMIFTILLLLLVCQHLYVILFPFSELAKQFLSDQSLSRGTRTVYFAVSLVIISGITFVAFWCMQVSFISYQYFEDRQRRIRTRNSRPPVDTRTLVQMPAPEPPTESFNNPNYSISDDEDEIFRAKTGPAIV